MRGNMLRLVAQSGVLQRTVTRQFHTSAKVLAGGSVQHIDEDENLESTPFDFTDENYAKIREVMKRYPTNYKSSGVIPLLDLAQRQCGGWVPLSAMNKVARILDMPPMRVYEVATFYTMFNRRKIGKYNVQVCTTTPCMVRGGYDIMDAVVKHLGIKAGGDTKDGLFHLMEVECLGACANAPMVQINDDFYEDLTPESIRKILDDLKNGKQPKVGSQVGRNKCMGVQGKTCLFDKPRGPFAPGLEALDAEKKLAGKSAEK